MLEFLPLAEEEELRELVQADDPAQLPAHVAQRGRLTQRQFVRPILPVGSAVAILEGQEQGEIVEPARLLHAKRLERRTQRGGRPG